MGRLYELFKNYLSLISLIGMSFVQVLNIEPSNHSFVAFVLFTVLAVLVVISCAGIIGAAKPVRSPYVIGKPASTRLTRGAAAAALAVTPLAYVVLVVLFHIPNTWPILRLLFGPSPKPQGFLRIA